MGHTREKKPSAYTEEAKLEAKHIVNDFEQFVDGIRVLFLVHRSKDGATHKDRHLRTVITRDAKEFELALGEMLELKVSHERFFPDLRIYSSVNSRNAKKAIVTFSHEMVDADHGPEPFEFYFDMKSRFVSALMRPSNRSSSFFLFDVDAPMTLDQALGILDRSPEQVEIVKQYTTKNGWHIITTPFNYTKLEMPIPMQKDAILLLKY